jgi:hypothetical protein
VWLQLFWHRFHVHPTSGSTAVVYCYPQDNRAMTSLNISNTNIGELVPPEGWSNQYSDRSGQWSHTDGRKQPGWPAGSKPLGVIALAEAIKNMGAMTSLNLVSNGLGAEGAKIVAKAIKVTNYNYVYTCDNFDTIFMSI